jgi:hypothetical protein
MWEDLPPGSDIAVRIGLVVPIPCPDCGGTGKRAAAVNDQENSLLPVFTESVIRQMAADIVALRSRLEILELASDLHDVEPGPAFAELRQRVEDLEAAAEMGMAGSLAKARFGAPVPRGIGCLVIAVGIPFADCVREIRVEPGRLVFEYEGGGEAS